MNLGNGRATRDVKRSRSQMTPSGDESDLLGENARRKVANGPNNVFNGDTSKKPDITLDEGDGTYLYGSPRVRASIKIAMPSNELAVGDPVFIDRVLAKSVVKTTVIRARVDQTTMIDGPHFQGLNLEMVNRALAKRQIARLKAEGKLMRDRIAHDILLDPVYVNELFSEYTCLGIAVTESAAGGGASDGPNYPGSYGFVKLFGIATKGPERLRNYWQGPYPAGTSLGFAFRLIVVSQGTNYVTNRSTRVVPTNTEKVDFGEAVSDGAELPLWQFVPVATQGSRRPTQQEMASKHVVIINNSGERASTTIFMHGYIPIAMTRVPYMRTGDRKNAAIPVTNYDYVYKWDHTEKGSLEVLTNVRAGTFYDE